MTLTPYEHPELIPHGTLQTFDIEMTPYPDHRMRTIRVWLPEEYDGVRRFPVIYMHDGQGVFRGLDERPAMDMDRVLTALSAEGFTAIVVAVDTARTRDEEVTPPWLPAEPKTSHNGFPMPFFKGPSTTDTYADFIVKTLKPLIDENFMTLPDAANTCIGGASGGGCASYYMVMRDPEVFGRAFVYSPGFPLLDMEKIMQMLDEYDMSRLADVRIAFYNGDQAIDVTSVDDVLTVYRKHRELGMDPEHLMFLFDSRQTHSNVAWNKYMPEVLRFLFLGK